MTGAALSPARGRVLVPATTRTEAVGAQSAWVFLVLLGALPLFGETFAYVVDVGPLYALAKLWPVVTLPLAVGGALLFRAPRYSLVLLALAWMTGVTPLISMAVLGDGLSGAISGAIKVWPLAGVLALGALLAWLRPRPGQVERALHMLGFLTFAVMSLIWVLAPPSAYDHQNIETTKIFLSDPERGFRLNIPMFFGILWIFLLGRRFWARPSVLPALAMAGAFFLMLLIYKQRTQILGAGLIVALAPVLGLARRRGAWFGVLAGGAALLTPALFMLAGSHDTAATLGGSLTARQSELGHALSFLNDQPLRWLVGAGGATRAGDVDLAAIVGTNYFFLSDLGWVGVVFEYGAVGAALMLALHFTAIGQGWTAAKGGSPLAWALFDYCLYMVLVSPVLSVVFAPGELATCMALLAFSLGRSSAAPARSGSPAPVPSAG